jgi:HK97 family phage major capsid protein/HK97 family phage prohead protease
MLSGTVFNRAYAVLHVAAFNDDARTFTGIATTPTPDRRADVLEPLGATFTNPIPLLFHHDREQPIGLATLGKPTAAGVPFEAAIPRVDEPGRLRDRVDEAWQSIKAGIIRGVSVGYRPLKNGIEPIKDGGLRFTKTELVELSLVTVPANVEATILTIKSLDTSAASGLHISGVADRLPVVRAVRGDTPMTITEQITQFERTRGTKSARMSELMTAAAAENVTLDATQTEEYDGLALEVKSIDAHLVRLRDQEKTNAAAAVAVAPVPIIAAAAAARNVPIVQVKSQLPKGTAFVRYCQAVAACHGDLLRAVEWSKQWKDSTPEVELVLKAAVAPGTSTDATWAGPLAPIQPLATEFLELLRPSTILGKVDGFIRVPFNVSVPAQTGGGTYGWVGQGAPKPVTKLTFGTVTITITKCAGIVVITEELARNSNPSAEAIIQKDMINGIAQFLDVQFIDPTVAAVAGVSPGSITNGVTPITSAGTTPANARTDVIAMMNAFTAALIPISGATLIMSEANALALSAALNPLGQPLWPNLMMTGGTGPLGLKVVTSQSAGNNVVLVSPGCILWADDGGVTIDVSREASVQMDSAPDNPALATTVLTSLWQNNLVGLRAERFINWKKARTGCVAYTVQTYAG